ncbi:MAG: putative sulfate exporter family transporter [Planctomycetes bacterium]|nr:putative sulfate exporter family transporter [Planctomycetota bacterium]
MSEDNQAAEQKEDKGEGGSRWSELYKTEDYWAIWLGLAIIAVGLVIFLPRAPEGMDAKIQESNTAMAQQADEAPFRTIAWYKASDAKRKLKATGEDLPKTIKKYTGKPHGWKTNPIEAFVVTEPRAVEKKAAAQEKLDAADEKLAKAEADAKDAEEAARAADFKDDELNDKAEAAIVAWRNAKPAVSSASKKVKAAKPLNQIGYLLAMGAVYAALFGIGMLFMGKSFGKFILGFSVVFLVAVLAQMFAAQANVKDAGLGYAAWAILFGLLISNTIGTPNWVKPAVQTEYFIKTGLVLLGAEILFSKIVTIGVPGIFVAWVVTPIVLITTYLFGQKVLKIPSKTLNMTISADMSVCGVSAAIATAAACRAKKEELTLAVGLSLVFTSVMMVVMPAFIKAVGMPQILGGAWMGGTIDATGAVAAAGEFLGEKALYVAATIKMIQNVLIGVIAFCVATYWCLKVDREAGRDVGLMEIWYRFPKFVLGFIGVSVVFSLIYSNMGPDVGYTMIDNGVIGGLTKSLRGWFFCLAFVSIGLATNFRELKHHFKGGKPLILYVCGQSFNLCLTLLMAYIMFYLVFTQITEKI